MEQSKYEALIEKGYQAKLKNKFNGRILTELEAKFHKNMSCICCGQGLEVSVHTKRKTLHWPLECHACSKTRRWTHDPLPSAAATTNNSANKYKKIMGYKPKDVI